MWDQFVSAVGIVGTVFLIVFFSYLKWRKNQAIKEAEEAKKKQQNSHV